MSLIDICYEQIKDNFWYGVFGDFKLIIDKNTGYFNATKLCASAEKHYADWQRNKYSKSLMDYYTNLGPANLHDLKSAYEIKSVGTNPTDLLISGTYVREELILNIACWLSNDFYDKCYQIVKSYYVWDFSKIKNDNEKLTAKLNELEESLQNLRNSNETLNTHIEGLKREIVGLKNDRTEPTSSERKHHQFILIRKNIPDKYPYYALRVQKCSRENRISEVKEYFPESEVILALTVPNSVTLYNRLKESNIINWRLNHFNSFVDEENLILEILRLHMNDDEIFFPYI